MWLSPVSSPWTLLVTCHLHRPLLIPPPHPPCSPPTLAPLPNWEHLYTWVLSLDCKPWDFILSLTEASLCLVLAPNLIIMSSTSQPAETTCLSGPSAQLQKQIDMSYAYSWSGDGYKDCDEKLRPLFLSFMTKFSTKRFFLEWCFISDCSALCFHASLTRLTLAHSVTVTYSKSICTVLSSQCGLDLFTCRRSKSFQDFFKATWL